ncbi:MAG: 2-keto-4-pentenoate hydratase [Betaproteobacteria bacterium RIFCSPLOWO2_02_FULL_62_17]|nr:MAG: 2-keto-4-pentenoate hydratase [Betaproteobacteria bacterium RIFCSPLOWO2_02_FULL_62_17]
MIWCRFQAAGRMGYAIVEGERVIPVEGSPFGGYQRSSESLPLASVKLLVPVIPGTFFCAGVNYSDHITKMAKTRGEEPKLPTRAEIGYRANNALLEHEGNIVKPKDSTEVFQYEGELVAVFGKSGRHIAKEQALDCVLGWTIGNDVSERTWQRSDRSFWRSKNCDTFKPMGPWIVTGLDPRDLRTIIRLNGKVVDSFETGNMIFDAATFISETSRYCSIQAGDVMWLGTDGAPQNMKPGDTIEIEITGIGTLRNYVVAEA